MHLPTSTLINLLFLATTSLKVLASPLSFTEIERRWSAGETDVSPIQSNPIQSNPIQSNPIQTKQKPLYTIKKTNIKTNTLFPQNRPQSTPSTTPAPPPPPGHSL
jgi:hypothetical protein